MDVIDPRYKSIKDYDQKDFDYLEKLFSQSSDRIRIPSSLLIAVLESKAHMGEFWFNGHQLIWRKIFNSYDFIWNPEIDK